MGLNIRWASESLGELGEYTKAQAIFGGLCVLYWLSPRELEDH